MGLGRQIVGIRDFRYEKLSDDRIVGVSNNNNMHTGIMDWWIYERYLNGGV